MTLRFIVKQSKNRDLARKLHSIPGHSGVNTISKTGRHYLYVRIRDGRGIDWTRRTAILVNPSWWDTRREEIDPLSPCTDEEMCCVRNEMWNLRNHLIAVYLKDKAEGLLHEGWLECELMLFGRRNRKRFDLKGLMADFCRDRALSETRRRQYMSVLNLIDRFRESYSGLGKVNGHTFSDRQYPNIMNSDRQMLEAFRDFLRQGRGINTVNCILKKLRAFANWCVQHGFLDKSPFDGFHFDPDLYGTPVCLNVAEVEQLRKFRFKSMSLSCQRDIFVFQCNTGCRAGDLFRLGSKNISDGELSYIPSKTLRSSGRTITVPLNETAADILRKYDSFRSRSSEDRLLPFISLQKYNESIKKMLRYAGINRQVSVLDPMTRKEKIVRICDMASSHLARRTFINSIYQKVRDPELVASLTGHCEGSRAFNRYRTIDGVIKRELVHILDE